LYQPSLVCGALLDFQEAVPDIKEAGLSAECFPNYLETADDPQFVGSCALVVKRSVFEFVGGFDENMWVAEDHDFFFRTGTQPGFVRVRSPVTVGYRRHFGNISTSVQALDSAANDLLNHEFENRYPGARARKKQRWRLLTRVLRPIIFSLLRDGRATEAWRLYRRCFHMNVRLRRFRFLVGFIFYGAILSLDGRDPRSPAGLAARRRRRDFQRSHD
jgi:hypothetical protein